MWNCGNQAAQQPPTEDIAFGYIFVLHLETSLHVMLSQQQVVYHGNGALNLTT